MELPRMMVNPDVIDPMGGSLDHAPGIARGAYAAVLAGEGYRQVVSAWSAAGTGGKPRTSR